MPYVNKVVYGDNVLIDLTSDTVTSSNLRQGVTAHGANGAEITGSMYDRPGWMVNSKNSEEYIWTQLYFNIDAVQEYLDNIKNSEEPTISINTNQAFLMSLAPSDPPYAIILIRTGDDYALAVAELLSSDSSTIIINNIKPIYATVEQNFSFTSMVVGSSLQQASGSVNCEKGWNNYSVAIPSENEIYSFINLFDSLLLYSAKEIAYGAWVRKQPNGKTLTITQNGTYTFDELSKYDKIIINVPTGGGEDKDVEVDGSALIFDDNTAVAGNTLILDIDAEVKNNSTLVFTEGSSDATIDGNILEVDAQAENNVITLDAAVDKNTLIL